MSQALYELPEGWEWVELGDVATLLNGRAYKQHELLDEGKTPVLRVGNFFSNRSWYYSDLDLPEEKYCVEGDLLYAWSASFGPKIWTGQKAIYHYHIWKILTSEKISKWYLYHLLERETESIKASGNGVGMFHATKSGMEKKLIPLPPLTEQTRIVEKLDAVLSRIDTAIDELQQSIALVDAMFKSGLDKAFNPLGSPTNEVGLYDLPDGWGWHLVKDISQNIQYGHTAKATDSGNAGFLRITDIQDGMINWSGVPFVEVSEKELTKYELQKNDLVFARSGATAGKSILIDEPPKNMIFASYLIRIIPNQLIVFPKYLALFFQSPMYWSIVMQNASGAAQPNINGTKLGEFSVPLPNLAEQQRVVEALDALNDKTTQLKTELTAKIGMFNQLKASVLDGAFRGEL